MQANTKNKVALITGCAKRIGKEVALHLAKTGWKIITHFNKSQDEALELSSEINNYSQSYLISFDLRQENDYPKILAKITNEFYSPTLLINNASSFDRDSFSDITIEKLERQIRINCHSQIMLSKAFFENNKLHNLNIINFNDYAATKLNSTYLSYYMSKNLFLYSSNLMAGDMSPRCRVNTISFGHVIKDDGRSDDQYNRIIEQTPLMKRVKISDINNAVDFLINSESVTGTNICIDSGANIKPTLKL